MGTSTGIEQLTAQYTKANLPEGWRIVRFGDVVRNVDVSERDPLAKGIERYIGLDHIDPESLHIKRWGLIEDGTSFSRKFVTGQILFGKRRAYQRKVAVTEFEGICSGDILVFEAKDGLLPELLPFIVQSNGFFEHALDTSAGSLSPRTKWKDLAAYEFPLPPIDEQRRIADILWAADETTLKYESLLEAIKRCKQTLIREAYLSTSISFTTLGNYSTLVTSGSRGWAKYYAPEGCIFIRVTNLTREIADIDLRDLEYVQLPLETEGTRTRVITGDILISITADLGRVAVVTPDFLEAYVNQHVALARLLTDILDPYFVAYYLLSPEGQKQFYAFNDAGTKAGMNLQNVRRLRIPFAKLDDQRRFVRLFRTLDSQIGQIQNHLIKQAKLNRSILELLNLGSTSQSIY